MICNDYHLKCYRLNDTLSLAAGASEGRFGVGISDNLFSIKKKVLDYCGLTFLSTTWEGIDVRIFSWN